MEALEIEVGAPQGRSEEELGEGAFALGLARPFLGRDDDGARLAMPGDDLWIGLGALDYLRHPGLGVCDGPATRSPRGWCLGGGHGPSFDYSDPYDYKRRSAVSQPGRLWPGGHCTIPSGQAVKIDLGNAEGTYRARRCPGERPLPRDGVL